MHSFFDLLFEFVAASSFGKQLKERTVVIFIAVMILAAVAFIVAVLTVR